MPQSVQNIIKNEESGKAGFAEQRRLELTHCLLEDLPLLKGKRGDMKSNKKKTNKDRDSGITWCMAEIYSMKLILKALIKEQKEINDKLGDSHKEKTA